MQLVKRAIVVGLAQADHVLDEVLYRPAVVKAFMWLPRWWRCDLAKASIALDERWSTGYWSAGDLFPGPTCEACGRRASVFVTGKSLDPDERAHDYISAHPNPTLQLV
jgi:hypothetical protein